MEITLEQYPHNSMNNARAIVRKDLIKMREFPSEMQAQKLESNYGIVCDWSDKDYGEPLYKHQ